MKTPRSGRNNAKERAAHQRRTPTPADAALARGWREGTLLPCTLSNALLASLGDGPIAIAAALGLPVYRVHDWMRRGRISTENWAAVLDAVPLSARVALGADVGLMLEDAARWKEYEPVLETPEDIKAAYISRAKKKRGAR